MPGGEIHRGFSAWFCMVPVEMGCLFSLRFLFRHFNTQYPCSKKGSFKKYIILLVRTGFPVAGPSSREQPSVPGVGRAAAAGGSLRVPHLP